MKEINLFVDFEFTSLSPDAQPISIGIVSEHIKRDIRDAPQMVVPSGKDKKPFFTKGGTEMSFYAEFSDFDINRCDDWVKENVVGKLKFKEDIFRHTSKELKQIKGTTHEIKHSLKNWLEHFSDYQITFVVDCGVYDWYWLLQLLAEWEDAIIDQSYCPCCGDDGHYGMGDHEYKIGLPMLPDNISPVPFELNQLIAEKKGISIREAFELNRENLCLHGTLMINEKDIPYGLTIDKITKDVADKYSIPYIENLSNIYGELSPKYKHNALWDAKVMKAIYEKLSV